MKTQKTVSPFRISTPFVRALLIGFLACRSASAADAIDVAKARVEGNVAWYDIRQLGVEGQGWSDTAAPFDRFPAKAEKTVRGSVWGLSRHSAGLCVRFVTDSPEIHAKWTLTSPNLAMNHMPATGVSGLDLYVKTESGKWRWLAVGRPTAQTNQARLASGIPQGTREYMLYLPLYNGVKEVEVGLPKTAQLKKAPPRTSRLKPIVFYGTSITQGGCASRPGMVHTAILGRWLDAPVINLGFSGNGRMETEVAELIAELDPSVIVLDCLPNISAGDVTARTGPVMKILRKRHPKTPILLVEDRSYTDSFLIESKRVRNETSRAALTVEFEKLKKAGDANVFYLTGEDLLGDDGEGTVDSSHPTDLGFVRQAEAFQKVLAPILKK
jgi:hypothetical protein